MNKKEMHKPMNSKGCFITIISLCIICYVVVWGMIIAPIYTLATAYDQGLITGSLIATNVLKFVFSGFVSGMMILFNNALVEIFDGYE